MEIFAGLSLIYTQRFGELMSRVNRLRKK